MDGIERDGTSAPSKARLRVVELGSWLAAPGTTALLADIGAEVIKVEPPGGDPGRQFIQAMGSDAPSTPSFSLLNRGKKSIMLDLATASDRAELERLIASADVFVTNLRGHSLERLGLDPDKLLPSYPRLIYASITGLGLRGPECDTPVYDVGGFWARSGLMHQLAPADAAPPCPTGGFGDIITSLAAYAAIVTALLEREKTGCGGLVETSLLQSGAFVASGDLAVQAAHGRVASQRVRTSGRTPMVNCYRSSDKRWFFLTGVEASRHFPAVCRAIGRHDLIGDPRFANPRGIRKNGEALVALLDEAFAERPLEEWAATFKIEGVWWQPVMAPAEVLADEQVSANAMLRPVWNGGEYYPMVTAPFKLSRSNLSPVRAPELGEHNQEVLSHKQENSDDSMGKPNTPSTGGPPEA